jgi:catechol 2,3-dioxygenase-like lactoylglutathione lyase family enzyme
MTQPIPTSQSLIASIDHVVITTPDIQAALRFYVEVLGMRAEQFGGADGKTRWALKFGDQKFNLQQADGSTGDVVAVAKTPTPGSLDLCFLAAQPLDSVMAQLRVHGIPVLIGPVRRTGARFLLKSVYIRDPDGNLIEISEPDGTGASA